MPQATVVKSILHRTNALMCPCVPMAQILDFCARQKEKAGHNVVWISLKTSPSNSPTGSFLSKSQMFFITSYNASPKRPSFMIWQNGAFQFSFLKQKWIIQWMDQFLLCRLSTILINLQILSKFMIIYTVQKENEYNYSTVDVIIFYTHPVQKWNLTFCKKSIQAFR